MQRKQATHKGSQSTRAPKLALVPVSKVSLRNILPSPENDELYGPVDWNDPDIHALAESIRKEGLKEPLVITADNYIVSGHRRCVAARIARRKFVPCRRLKVNRKGHRNYLNLLRVFNLQRVKTRDQQLREEIVSANPDDAYRVLRKHREQAATVGVDTIQIREHVRRHEISKAKHPFLDAILKIIEDNRQYWPLSDRLIHYQLLNNPPLIHAAKPGSRYRNHPSCYKALTVLLTQARHERYIDYDIIHDPTRPETVWNVHNNVAAYYRQEINNMFNDFYRDLLQSQPNHVEIIVEKNTVQGILRPVASEYCMPFTVARGFCSTSPRFRIVERYRTSGKERLIVLVVSDFDPDGEEIAHSLARSLRDDFGIQDVQAIKVALTSEQVQQLALPEGLLKAKPSSPNYKRFKARYGDSVFELEAVPPEKLQQILRGTIQRVLDLEAFQAEIEAEKSDAAHLSAVRARVIKTLQEASNIET